MVTRHLSSFVPIALLLLSPSILPLTSDGCSEVDPDPTPSPTPLPISDATYYVSPTGDDADPGSLEQPWQTLEHAVENAYAGDTVYLRDGTWYEALVPAHSGSADHPILFAAMPGESPILDGTDVQTPYSTWGGLIHIIGVDHIHIQGLTVVHSPVAGFFCDDTIGIRLEDNHSYDTVQSGIGVWASEDVLISGNEVELACNDGDQECITVADTDGFEVVGNHVFNGGPGSNGGEGIDAKDGSRNGRIHQNVVHNLNRLGIYVDAWDEHTYNIDVFQNTVYECKGSGLAAAAEAGGLLEDIRFENNLAWLNTYNGFTLASWGQLASHPMQNITVINNTFVENGTSWGGGIEIDNREATDILIRNNILSQNEDYQLLVTAAGDTLVLDHNLIDGYRGGERDETLGDNPIEGSPDFVDSSTQDFHLSSSSPAIDGGSAEGAPSEDFDGVARPQGVGYDVGAYEYY